MCRLQHRSHHACIPRSIEYTLIMYPLGPRTHEHSPSIDSADCNLIKMTDTTAHTLPPHLTVNRPKSSSLATQTHPLTQTYEKLLIRQRFVLVHIYK